MNVKFPFLPVLVVTLFLHLGTMEKVECQSASAAVTNAPLSNAVTQTEPQHNDPGTYMAIPVIQFHDVPLHTAIENFARVAKINYQIDPRLSQWWETPDIDGAITHEPILSIYWTNLTAREALLDVLNNYNLVLAEDPLTSVARITYTNQTVDPGDVRLLGDDKIIIPLIQFEHVPITTALENFGRAANISYVLDPAIGYGMPDKQGKLKVEPAVSIRWENVTGKQAFIAICENYDLIITKGTRPDMVLIKAKK
ncbi:MAG TPA: hypothetical protein VK742_16105 [Candidatus Sulfotelmatobacter sp.]|jgi:hypothetical protein|nr:hypothetical protein [Candidatus Sulfotelmatobacter sp.]